MKFSEFWKIARENSCNLSQAYHIFYWGDCTYWLNKWSRLKPKKQMKYKKIKFTAEIFVEVPLDLPVEEARLDFQQLQPVTIQDLRNFPWKSVPNCKMTGFYVTAKKDLGEQEE